MWDQKKVHDKWHKCGRGEAFAVPSRWTICYQTGFGNSSFVSHRVEHVWEENITLTIDMHFLQLFWPDDNMWYLVRVEKVDLKSRTAQ